MAGPINNNGGLGLNGSKAGSLTPGLENKANKSGTESDGQASKLVTDEVSLSAAGKQLNAQESSGTKAAAFKIETPEQAEGLKKIDYYSCVIGITGSPIWISLAAFLIMAAEVDGLVLII